jgi:hypothetical protein
LAASQETIAAMIGCSESSVVTAWPANSDIATHWTISLSIAWICQ